MKKSIQILALAVTLLLPWVAKGQATLTVADGAATNGYVPVYGFYADAYLRSQFVYPDTMLTSLASGGTIGELKFYASTTNASWGNATFKVYMGTTTSTTLSSFESTSNLTEVYEGPLSIVNGEMTIALDEVFGYNGGNLLIEVSSVNTGSYVSCTFLGVTSTGSSIQGYSYTDLASVSPTQRNFLPKMQLSYSTGEYCFPVRNLNISDVSSDSFTANWNTGGSETSWAVSIDGGTTWSDVSDSSYTFYGLNPNTNYTVSVISLCSTGDTGAVRSASCHTACSGYTQIPYSEDFEGIATDSLPNCWLQVVTGTNNNHTFPSVYVYASNTRNGSGYFEFESSSSSSNIEIVALPAMEDINTLRLSMWVSSSSSYPCSLEVGVLEDDTLFVPVDSLNLITFSGSNDWKTNYHEYVTFFNNYSGSGERIAIRATRTGSGQFTLFIDDLTVSIAGEAEVTLPPTAVTNINTDLVITANVGGDMSSMTYSWSSIMNNNGEATMSVDDNVLTINYTTPGIDTVTIIVSNTYGTDTASMIVRALDLSPITQFPYNNTFETGSDLNWQFVNGGNDWVIDTAVNNTPNGNTALYISNDNGVSNTYNTSGTKISYVYRPMQFDATGEYSISFDWRANGEGAYDYLRAWIAPATFEFTPNQLPDGSTSCYSYQTTTPTGWIDLGGRMNLQSNWQTLQTTFSINAVGSYNLVFMWCNDVSGGSQPPAAIDNIILTPLSCSAVVNLTLDSVSADEMTFHWQPVGSESMWQVVIGDTIDVAVTDTTFTASNLTPNTPYTVSVYALCGSNDTSFATSALFRTACSDIAIIPWSENFDSEAYGSAPSCWTVFGGTPRISSSSSNAHSGSNYLHFSGSNSNMIALPSFVDDINTLQVRFWTRPEGFTYSSCGSFSVGYMTDANDPNSFVAVQTWNYDDFSDYEEREVPFASAPDSAVLIAFRHNATSSYYYWYVDDVVVEPIPACAHPVSVTAVATSDSDIDVTIVGISGDSYRLYWTDGITTDSADVNDTAYTITNLSAQTLYTISAATLCSDGSITTSVVTSARTQCMDGGCDIIIDMADSFGDGWNGNAIQGYVNGESVFSATISNGSSNTLNYSICNGDTIALLWTSGSYSSETSFSISIGSETLVSNASGSDYSTGDTLSFSIGCPNCPSPENLVIDNVTADEIDFHWTPRGSESSWIVSLNGALVATVNTPSYSATGLTHSTAYNISVCALCDGNSDTSFALIGSAQTLILATEFPYSTGFEPNDDRSWLVANSVNGWFIGSATSFSGTQSIYISNDNGVSNNYTGSTSYSFAYKLFHIGTPGDYAVGFDWQCTGEGSTSYPYDYLRVFAAPATATFVAGVAPTNLSSTPDGWTSLDGGSPLNQQSGWQHHDDTLSVASDTTLFIVFVWKNDASIQNQPPAAIDNFYLGEGGACSTPTISNTVVTENSVSFTIVSSATSNEVVIMAGSWVEPTTPGTVVTTTTHTFNGLNASSQYTIGLRALCDDGQNSPWNHLTITTADQPCETPSTPAVNDVSTESATITWTAPQEQSAWELRLFNNIFDTLISANTTTVTVTNLVADLTYDVTVRAICGENSYSQWSDTVSFTTINCPAPTGVTVTDVTDNSALVSWTSTGVDKYQVEYGLNNFGQGLGTTVTVTGGTTSLQLSDLQPQRVYDVYVRAFCTETNHSNWSNVVTFTTTQNGIEDVSFGEVTLFPNPASSSVTLRGIEGATSVSLVDVNGVETSRWNVNGGELTFDVSLLAKGAYFLRITGEQTTIVRKLIVK